MARPYSIDLRERLVAAVWRGGIKSRRAAAARFEVAESHGGEVDAARVPHVGLGGAGQDGRAPEGEADPRASIGTLSWGS